MKKLFLLSILFNSIVFAQTAELNRDNQSAISFLPENGDSIFHIAHGLNNDLNISQGANVGGTNIMTIKNFGSIGIGTTTPVAKLDIENGDFYIGEEASANGTRRQLRVYGYDNSAKFYGSIHSNYDDYKRTFDINTNNQVQQIKIDASANSYANIVLNPGVSGNVGVGTTTPTDKLHVNGVIRSESKFVITGIGALNADSNSGDMKLWSTSGLVLSASSETNNHLRIQSNGNVGIGTTDTQGFKLGVNGKIAATEVKVATYANWADFVFNTNYDLPTLKEVEQHIKEKGHLKDIPNAEEVKKDGFYLAEMNAKLLQKIEELTLYTIEQEKEIDVQDSKIESQNNRIEKLEKENQVLKSLLERVEKLEANIKS